MGAAIVLAFACYLRPCELLSLRSCDIVPPPARGPPRARKWTLILRPAEVGLCSKTGARDET
eukprot:8693690-Lingulodinium_polyedra.AAC.1